MLAQRRHEWGAAAVYAISVAFYEASRRAGPAAAPRILFNLLNGGLHAYTNPITADVTEFLLVPRSEDLEATIAGYAQLLRDTRRALAEIPAREVGGNRVHDLGPEPNVAAFALVEELLGRAGLTDLFGIMIDASAGDWYDGGRYRLPVTERTLEPEQLVDEWLGLMDRFELEILEDPFAETDLAAWQLLHEARPPKCGLYGDNLTSTRPEELEAKVHLVDGVLIKPDQNGTVSGTLRFADAARRAGLRLAASHRSIETDSPFLVHLAADVGVDYTKIGPFSDFSAVMRTNSMLREAQV
jgi:enolase